MVQKLTVGDHVGQPLRANNPIGADTN